MDRVLTVSARKHEPDTWGMPGYDDRHVKNTLIDSSLIPIVEGFYFSEYANPEAALLAYCSRFQPQAIMLSINNWPPEKSGPPTVKAFQILKSQFNIPITMFWFDIHVQQFVQLLINYSSIADLHVMFGAHTTSHIPLPTGIKYIYAGLPFENCYSNLPNVNKDIDIGFLGTSWKNRAPYITALSERGFNIYTAGGLLPKDSTIVPYSKENTSWMPYTDYLALISRLKISLNFSQLAEGRSQVRARVWETLLCRSLLFEEDNLTTPEYFTPYIDYVPFNSVEDLIFKIEYYLEHEEECDNIRYQGWETVNKCYSATVFWQNIFNILDDLESCITGTIYNKGHLEAS